MAILSVRDLKAYYLTQLYGVRRDVKAVDGLTLEIRENEVFGIAGESGCGKTTLIKVLTGLIQPPLMVMGGEVRYSFPDQVWDVLSLKNDIDKRKIRGARVSYIPQGSMNVLNPVRRIKRSFRDFVGAHRRIADAKELEQIVLNHLKDLGLSADMLEAYPHQLSGGMRQRVTIALATILKPGVILADEPSTALDVITQRGVIQLLKKIKQEMKNTIVLVTHDMAIHANICDRVAIMYAGQIVEEAPVAELFRNAYHPYTKFLLASLPCIGDKSCRESAPGTPPSLIDPPDGCRFHPRCPNATGACREVDPEMVWIGSDHRVACIAAKAG